LFSNEGLALKVGGLDSRVRVLKDSESKVRVYKVNQGIEHLK
jgi:hypothetical protein